MVVLSTTYWVLGGGVYYRIAGPASPIYIGCNRSQVYLAPRTKLLQIDILMRLRTQHLMAGSKGIVPSNIAPSVGRRSRRGSGGQEALSA